MRSETMTDLLHRVVAAAWDLPAEMQDEMSRLVLAYADELPRVFQPGEAQDSDASRGRGQDER